MLSRGILPLFGNVLIAAIVLLLGISTQSIAGVKAGMYSIDASQGLFTFYAYVAPEQEDTYDVSKVQFAMPTVPESSVWTAQGPWWFYNHPESSLNWDVSIEPLTETGVSWYHDLPMTAITWTAQEPLQMRQFPNILQFQVQTPAWGLPTDWSVVRIWNSSGDLLCWGDCGPLMQPVPEPSSIIVIIGGLASLGGFALKRRSASN